MVKTKQETLRETNLMDSPFFKVFAKNYLDYLGNSHPTHKQLAEIQALLSNTWIRLPIHFDLRLSEQEKQCLYLSAQGKGLKEIASFLNVSMRRVTQHRQAIFKKLGCRNITSAIIVGIRYGVIKKENVLDD
ncbi:response regulator transcription factor [Legionella feeleii]|uniref:Transcriptional regulator LuxR n=1 Tax=Legionella feeleii TaxID=453 RepID=A0A0W0TLH6_9GAMM|nr:LuxR C-terminal-related transcriptional regulator [Legionella feeleii]KTC96439.1 transcriptional regulator LuxR [Legionella feeleii]SPX61796.1 transcriptional regulator LuxR [Legionella feeleii]